MIINRKLPTLLAALPLLVGLLVVGWASYISVSPGYLPQPVEQVLPELPKYVVQWGQSIAHDLTEKIHPASKSSVEPESCASDCTL